MPSRFFALLCGLSERLESRRIRAARVALVDGLAGEVLEVGAGTGANFGFYPAGARVTATDFSPHMVKRAVQRAERSSNISVQQADAQALPFADHRFDHTVAALVFCSVNDPAAGLAELRRVTKPGGEVRFLEHIRSDGPRIHRLQRWITPAWRVVCDGCHLDRDTIRAIERAGLQVESVQQVDGLPRLVPMKLIRTRVP